MTGSQSTRIGSRPEIADDLGRGRKGHRRHEHGLPRAEAQGFDRQVQRGRAELTATACFAADGRGELLLEPLGQGPVVSQPERRHDDDFVDLRPSVIEGRKKGTFI